MPQLNKDETFWNILNSAIELDFRKGHQRWTMSELARNSKITRSLVYYYFGKSKETILLEAVKLIGEEFFGLNPARLALWQKGQIAESVIQTRKLLEKCPHMGTFYMVNREASNQIGEALRQLEKEYTVKLKRFFSGTSDAGLEAVFGLFLGLVITPRISDEAIRLGVQAVLELSARQ